MLWFYLRCSISWSPVYLIVHLTVRDTSNERGSAPKKACSEEDNKITFASEITQNILKTLIDYRRR